MTDHSLKSRKILAFCVVVIGVVILVAATTLLRTPENVSIQALWVVGACGLFTVGGQSLVDAVAHWRAGEPKVLVAATIQP